MNKLAAILMIACLPSCLFGGGVDPVDEGDMNADAALDLGDAAQPSDAGGDTSTPDAAMPDVSEPDLGDCPPQIPGSIVVNVANDGLSDGVCDCTCSLRDALDHVEADGSIGFDVTDVITAEAPLIVTTRGVSITGTAGQVEIAGDMSGALLSVGDTAQDVTISGIGLSGGDVALALFGSDPTITDVVIHDSKVGLGISSTGAVVDDVTVQNCGVGALIIGGAGRVAIQRSEFIDSQLHGVFVTAGAGEVQIRDGEISRNGGHGVQVRRSNVQIEGNRIAGNQLHGVFVDIESPGAQRTMIRRNEIGGIGEPNGLAGVEVVRAGAIDIGGAARASTACNGECNLIGPNRYGVLVQSAVDINIQGNYIGADGGNADRANGAGIIVGTQSTYDLDADSGAVLGTGRLRRRVGGACAHSGDCRSGVVEAGCVTEKFDAAAGTLEYPGGMCTASCDVSNPCADGVCANGVCLATCQGDGDCRSGYSCSNRACVWGQGAVPPVEPAWPESRGSVLIGRFLVGSPPLPLTNCIGGCNLIGHNAGDGINLVPGGSSRIVGNLVGTALAAGDDAHNGTDALQHAGITIHTSAAAVPAVEVIGNVVGSNTGFGMVVRNAATVSDNWIGFAIDGVQAAPNQGGVVLGNGHAGSVVERNLIGHVSQNAVLVAQGATDARVSFNEIGVDSNGAELGRAYDTGIRLQDAGISDIQVLDNSITRPTRTGIAVGRNITNSSSNQLSRIQIRRNLISLGAAQAGLHVFGLTDSGLSDNTVSETDGPGIVLGDDVQPVDFTATVIAGNTLDRIGEFVSVEAAFVMLGGTNAIVDSTTINDPDRGGFALGSVSSDPSFEGTVFQNNTVNCVSSGYCQGSGFLVRSGYGAAIEANSLLDVGDYGLDFADARTSYASVAFWRNMVADAGFGPINFAGTTSDDGRDDADNGSNTLLNSPTISTIAVGGAGNIAISGSVNFANARIDIYRSSVNLYEDFFEHLGTCASQPSVSSSTPEAFTCGVPGTLTNGTVVDYVQATVSGRHFEIQLTPSGVVIGDTFSVMSVGGAANIPVPSTMAPLATALWLATELRSRFPQLLASAQPVCAGGGVCVHVVTGGNDDAFNVSGPAVLSTKNRGWVTSAHVDGVHPVP